MERFCRIVETTRQTLIVKSYEPEEEKYKVTISCYANGLQLSAAMTFDQEEDQEEFFNRFEDEKYTDKIAESIFGDLLIEKITD